MLKSSSELSEVEFSPTPYRFNGFDLIEKLSKQSRTNAFASAKCLGPYLATLIIGVRYDGINSERMSNLKFLLYWIDHYFDDLFDILLLEQDSETRLSLSALGAKPYVRHAFVYNPKEFNRGWGYNVGVRHYCKDAKVIALMDTDVLIGSNFLQDIVDCHNTIDVASPYSNIYFTNADESLRIRKTMSLTHLSDLSRIKNPVTIAGGIVIFNRHVYMAIKGFEQYVGYGAEDRALDVAILNHVEPSKIRISPATYVHMFHDVDKNAKVRTKEIYAHLSEHYGCSYDRTLGPFDFIHKNCCHVGRARTTALMLARTRDFGDLDLYKRGDALAINGVRKIAPPIARIRDVTLPPNFDSLLGYESREFHKGISKLDASDLAEFYNRFLGHRCFIIGNGPSLNSHDLSLIANEYSFGVNSFYLKTRETGFCPTFYVVEDSAVMSENLTEICEYEVPFKFFPSIYRNMHPKMPNTFFFNMNRGFYEKSSLNYVVPRFSTDASKVLYCGQSVTYINLQLAYFMGFTEVYLIGMDFDYTIPESHKRNGDVLLSDTDDINHFHKDYFGKGKTWKDPKLDRVLINYRMANLIFNSVGRKIYNATNGGRLEEFERRDYELVLKDSRAKTNESLPKVDLIGFDKNMSLKRANELTRRGLFQEALEINKFLFENKPLEIYQQNIHFLIKKIRLTAT